MNKTLLTDNSHNFNIWYESEDPSFLEINSRSRVPYRWLSYTFVNGVFKDKAVCPINKYAQVLTPRPQLISSDQNVVRMRYYTHADIYLITDYPGYEGFYNVDRPWIRQYYQTKSSSSIPDNCFPGHYKLYAPWFINENVNIRIEESPNSSFLIYEKEYASRKIKESEDFVEPFFVNFNFKKEGVHMKENNFGIIRKNSPMFDIYFPADDIIVDKVRKSYEN